MILATHLHQTFDESMESLSSFFRVFTLVLRLFFGFYLVSKHEKPNTPLQGLKRSKSMVWKDMIADFLTTCGIAGMLALALFF